MPIPTNCRSSRSTPGREDIRTEGAEEGTIEVITAPTELKLVQDALAAQGLEIEDAQISMQPKALLTLDESDTLKGLRLIERLEDLDDVQEVYYQPRSLGRSDGASLMKYEGRSTKYELGR